MEHCGSEIHMKFGHRYGGRLYLNWETLVLPRRKTSSLGRSSYSKQTHGATCRSWLIQRMLNTQAFYLLSTLLKGETAYEEGPLTGPDGGHLCHPPAEVSVASADADRPAGAGMKTSTENETAGQDPAVSAPNAI